MEVLGQLHHFTTGKDHSVAIVYDTKWSVSGDRDILAKNRNLVIHVTASQYTNWAVLSLSAVDHTLCSYYILSDVMSMVVNLAVNSRSAAFWVIMPHLKFML
jgi:uncharacterized membrane protein YeiH